MTTTTLAPYLTQQFFTNNGTFNAGGTIATFAGGTNTPIATFTDVTGITSNTNPIVLNARGECAIWLLPNTSYKFVMADSAGNVIWTRDNVTNAQLLTLFGGIDVGAANAYILNFASPFSSYVNGEVIFWIPGNTNTGPSTLNVNGLGVIPITNIDGSALGANQIVAGQTTEVMFFNGAFQLISIGSFSGVTIGTFGQEVPLPSAATVDLGTAPAHVVLITGTATITSFGASANLSAPIYIGRFSGSLTLTFNAVSLLLPGNASIVTTAGDSFIAQYLGNGNWRVAFYQFAASGNSGNQKIKPADTVIVSSTTLTPDPDLQSNTLAVGRYAYELMLLFDSVSAGAGFKFQNDGTAVDSRALSPVIETGFINAAADGPKQSTFYATPISYATVSTAANSNQAIYKGSLLVSTPGTFGIEWAQVASTASATTLRAGSYLNLTLFNTGTSSNIVQHVYVTPGSFTETIPTGFNTLTLEVWGGSGGGGTRFTSGIDGAGGGGAGSGGYARSSISVTGLGGDTILFTVGAAGLAGNTSGGTSSAASGTLAITTMTCTGGVLGGAATGLFAPGAGGTFGTAVGGTVVNTSGNAGAAGAASAGGGTGSGGGGGTGGFGIAGINGGGNMGGHGAGLHTFTSGTDGGTGIIIFSYSV